MSSEHRRSFKERLGFGRSDRLKKTADVGGKDLEDSNRNQPVTIVDHGHGHLNPLSWDNLPSLDITHMGQAADEGGGGGGGGMPKYEEKQEKETDNKEKRRSRHLSKSKPKGTLEHNIGDRDTLVSIAAQFDTTPSELKKINKLMTNVIFPGQVIYVPDNDYISSGSSTPTHSPTDKPADTVFENATNKPNIPDVPLVRQTEPPVRGPGHAMRQKSIEETSGPPRRVSEEEAQRLDNECLARFIKVNVKHITDGQGVVSGVLLVTPNAIMFDPNVSDPLVIERGADAYGMIAPMETIISAAMYHDIAAMKLKGIPPADKEDNQRPQVYHAKHCPMYKEKEEVTESLPVVPPGEKASQPDTTPGEEHTPPDPASGGGVEQGDRTTKRVRMSSACSCGALSPEGNLRFDEDRLKEELKEEAWQGEDGKACDDVDSVAGKVSGLALTDAEDDIFGKDKDGACDNEQSDHKVAGKRPSVDIAAASKARESVEWTLGNEDLRAGGDQGTDSSKPTPSPFTPHMQIGNIMYYQYDDTESKNQSTETQGQSTDQGQGQHADQGQGQHEDKGQGQSTDKVQGQVTDQAQGQGGNAGQVDLSDGDLVDLGQYAGEDLSGVALNANGTPQKGILKRTLGSITSIGSSFAGSSPNFSTLVDFSSGLFTRNQEERGRVRDIHDVDMKEPPSEAAEENLPEENLPEKKEHAEEDKPAEDQQRSVEVCVESVVKLVDKPELFRSLDDLIPKPARHFEDPPLYLCLRVGKPINKKVSTTGPIESYMKKRMRSEYWFSIPRDKVDPLYAFFVQWTPELYGSDEDIKPEERGFVVIEDEDDDDDDLNMVDDHYKADRKLQRQMSKDWELVNAAEVRRRSILIPDEDPFILPEMSDQSTIMSDDHIRQLSCHLPARAEGYAWTLVYSSDKNGFSLKTLYRSMGVIDSPILLTLKDTNNQIFGALLSCALRQSDHFYGNGESYLFSFYPEFKRFNWTGSNNFFIKGETECLAIGAGEGFFGLWLDGDLYHGRTQKCQTFENDVLTETEDFVIKGLEAWAFL